MNKTDKRAIKLLAENTSWKCWYNNVTKNKSGREFPVFYVDMWNVTTHNQKQEIIKYYQEFFRKNRLRYTIENGCIFNKLINII